MTLSTRHETASGNPNAARVLLAVVLSAWFLAAALAGAAGWYVTGPGEPPLLLGVAAVGPVVVFAAVYAFSERFRTYVRSGDPVFLTYLQSWRVLGGVFLVLMSFGLLPAAFAQPAGWGDVFIGATAPFVARAIAAGAAARHGRWVIGWQLLGVLDLVSAIATGASIRTANAPGAEQMVAVGQLPLSLIPTFAVPLLAILHFATIAQLRAATVGAEEAPRAVLGEVG